ncbi:MAG TPA: hypothetical protein VGR64_04940, partial [Terracidiphilus sp.]|nr:hypothetical protein [Terracidiphilus sp.]
MRRICCLALVLMVALPVWAKTDKPPKVDKQSAEGLALLAAAAPHYDFSSPDMKPWHLKAMYQLYDDAGKPMEQGTYEYWWASPKVYRATWTRKSASESDWTTDKGVFTGMGVGDGAGFYEYALARELLAPFPKADEYASANAGLMTQRVEKNGADIECVMVVPRKVGYDFIV